MILNLHPVNPEKRKLEQISESLKEGQIFLLPTDTVYSLVADSHSKKGVDQLYEIKKIPKNQPLSLLCNSIEMVSHIVEFLPNPVFQIMKKLTPGPYTFILKASKNLPKPSVSHQKEKQIGIRIPQNRILLDLIQVHGGPLTATSASVSDDFFIEMEELQSRYEKRVAGIVDGGIVSIELSTILDCTKQPIEILRSGKGMEALERIMETEQ